MLRLAGSRKLVRVPPTGIMRTLGVAASARPGWTTPSPSSAGSKNSAYSYLHRRRRQAPQKGRCSTGQSTSRAASYAQHGFPPASAA
jgi:hypothetical protein